MGAKNTNRSEIVKVLGCWAFGTLAVFLINPVVIGIWILVLTPGGGTLSLADGGGQGWRWDIEPQAPLGYLAGIALIVFGVAGILGAVYMLWRLSRRSKA